MSFKLVNSDFARKDAFFRAEKVGIPGRKKRLLVVGLVALVWAGLLVTRLYSLQISHSDTWKDWALRQHNTELELASERGAIYDRNGKMLAVSVPAGSIYVRPRLVKNKEDAAQKLAKVLDLPVSQVRTKIVDSKPFVWVKRQIPRPLAQQVLDLQIPGVNSVLESRRFYPYNEAASTLIGKVGLDGHGLSGLEQLQERHLRGTEVKALSMRDALGNVIELAGTELEADLPKGQSLALTIDAGVQVIVDQELEAGRVAANAKSAMATLVDADTGEILAISQAPAMNLNMAQVKSRQVLTNKIVETVFEPGSIMKPFVAAAAIDDGIINTSQMVDCEGGRLKVGPHIIKDTHPSKIISFRDVIIRSSNIGMTKVGMRLGRDRLYGALRDFGFGESSGLGLPGESQGILRKPSDWALVDIATHSFGQGVAVTQLQVLRAMSALANGGVMRDLKIIKGQADQSARRVITTETAAKVRDLLYGVVEDSHGTGNKAAIAGVRIGGKTGTAQKPNPKGGGYLAGSYIASFVGFVDGSNVGVPRRLTLMVAIDEPHTNSIYGGTLAAPVFKRIMQRSLHALGMQAELQPENTEINPGSYNKARLVPASFKG